MKLSSKNVIDDECKEQDTQDDIQEISQDDIQEISQDDIQEISQDDINAITSCAQCSEWEAIKAFKKHKGNIVDAIIALAPW